MDIIAYMDDNRGKLHLLEQVWPKQIVTDWALAPVHRMRKALGDDSKNPRYIESVGGKGFASSPRSASRLPHGMPMRSRR